MFRNDSLFVEYDKNRFNTYKTAGLVSGDYANYLDRALSGVYNTSSVDNDIEKYSNPIKMVVSGPTSNIAGRYRNYLSGAEDNFLPSNQLKYGSVVQGFKPVKSPTTKDLATGWAYETTGDLLRPY